MTLAPVCTAAGLTIVNRCVAQCQGLAVAREGPCSAGSPATPAAAAAGTAPAGAAPAFLQPQHIAAGATVGLPVMTRYR